MSVSIAITDCHRAGNLPKKNKNKNKFILPVVLEGGRSELTDFGGGLLEGGSFAERHQASYGKNQSPSWLL